MAETTTLRAEPRDRAGKGAARAARRAGRVPGVIYGEGKPATLISRRSASELAKRGAASPASSPGCSMSQLDGTTHRALPRDVQLDPVDDQPIHVDFMRVGAGTRITWRCR